MESKYRILTTLKDGATVVGYRLYHIAPQSESLAGNNIRAYDKATVIKLARQGLVVNAKARRNGDGYLLIGIGQKLSDIPCEQVNRTRPQKMVLTHRVYDGRILVGYVIRNNHGQQLRITLEDAVRLASSNQIAGVKVQMFDGEPRLRGEGNFKMRDLPIVYVGRRIQQSSQSTMISI